MVNNDDDGGYEIAEHEHMTTQLDLIFSQETFRSIFGKESTKEGYVVLDGKSQQE